MDIENLNKKKREGGFTLVELAIVMIIIGLLIGGILKGQELIANSQITATVAQIKGMEAAISTFRDKYSALPGDMQAPEDRLACGDDCIVATGDVGNGRIDQGDGTPGSEPANDDEGVIAFSHLAAADLISGVIPDTNSEPDAPEFGVNLPEAKIGGGFWMGYSTGDLEDASDDAVIRQGHYLVLNGIIGDVAGESGAFSAGRAAQIDRKLDDGAPNSGTVLSNEGTACIDNATYAENDETTACALYIRVQG